jgi:uncharacterized protein YciI
MWQGNQFDCFMLLLKWQVIVVFHTTENQMFIVSLTYKTELSEVDQYIEAHVRFLDKYYTAGKFIASGRKVPRTGGIILIHAAGKAEVDSIIKEDPFYIADVADYEVTEFIPTKTAKEFDAIKNCI